jgi:hypothetical protein
MIDVDVVWHVHSASAHAKLLFDSHKCVILQID